MCGPADGQGAAVSARSAVSAAGFHWRETGGVHVAVPDFFDEVNLSGGYSTRTSGAGRELDLDLRGPKAAEEIIENRRLVCRAMGVELERLVVAEQVHGAAAALVDRGHAGLGALSPGDVISGADALVTADRNVALAVLSADCPVVLIADERRRAAAAVHSGRRGTVAGAVIAAVGALAKLGAPAETIYAAIGPSIGPCCYEVGADVAGEFKKVFEDTGGLFTISAGRVFLDLAAALRRQLVSAGVRAERIFSAPYCTRCAASTGGVEQAANGGEGEWAFFSYRRDGEAAGRFAGVISIGGG